MYVCGVTYVKSHGFSQYDDHLQAWLHKPTPFERRRIVEPKSAIRDPAIRDPSAIRDPAIRDPCAIRDPWRDPYQKKKRTLLKFQLT